MSIAVIGSGEIAELHAESLRRAGYGFSFAYDISPDTLKSFCMKTGATARASAEDILEDRAVDTVYLCTRHDSHIPLAKQALAAGKKVFLEKPLAMSRKEAEELAALPQTGSLYVGYNMRHTPTMRRFRELLDENAVCPESFELHMICAPFFHGWAGDPLVGGGVLVCEGSHMVDLITNTFGSPVESLFARTLHMRTKQTMCPDYASVMITLKNGIVGTVLLHDQGSYPYHVDPGEKMISLTVYSPQGTYTSEAYGSICYGNDSGYFSEKPSDGLDRVDAWGYAKQAELFLGDGKNLCRFDEAYRTVRTIDAARRSAAENVWITVDE